MEKLGKQAHPCLLSLSLSCFVSLSSKAGEEICLSLRRYSALFSLEEKSHGGNERERRPKMKAAGEEEEKEASVTTTTILREPVGKGYSSDFLLLTDWHT